MSHPVVPPLPAGVVHLWELDLDKFFFDEAITDQERARAARYHFERDRRRFVAGRSALRLLLGGYLACRPRDIVFSYGEAGKPSVQDSKVEFNLAHSGAHALIGFALEKRLGVDIEEIRPMDDMASVAQFSFAPGEFTRWQRAPEDEKIRSFYRCWSRKEAYLKAIGEGIARRLHLFEVAFEREEPARILRGAEGNWTLMDVSKEPAYAAAIAHEGPVGALEFHALASV